MQHAVLLGVLALLQSGAEGDVEVSCIFMESCILPCKFQTGGVVVLHWYAVQGDIPVHSFYYDNDQLNNQSERFRNRTSLFKDQISKGNSSLLLKGVTVQDGGRYKCYISNKAVNEYFINLKVDAPVRKVDIQQLEDRITCSSQGVYPEPTLTWTTKPRSNGTLQNRTSVQRPEQQLYSISSYLEGPDPGLDYSCNVSTALSHRTATWFQPTSIVGSHTEATIACRSSDRPPTGLTWRFNHSQVILNRTGTDAVVSEAWRPHVKNGSEPTSLTLEALSPRQEGLYSCELHDAEESFTSSFSLRLEESRSQQPQDSHHHAGVIAAKVIGAIILIAAILGSITTIWFRKYKSRKKKSSSNGQPERHEMGELMTSPREETEEVEEDEERVARRGDETNISTRGSDLLH